MLYTKKSLRKLLNDSNITTTAKSIATLLLLALDNGVVSREEVLQEHMEPKRSVGRPKKVVDPDEVKDEAPIEEPKRHRGRPRKYRPKIVDPDKPKDPKYDRIRVMSRLPIPVTLTNVETGEVRLFKSQCNASKTLGKGERFFARHNGEVVGGELIQVG